MEAKPVKTAKPYEERVVELGKPGPGDEYIERYWDD